MLVDIILTLFEFLHFCVMGILRSTLGKVDIDLQAVSVLIADSISIFPAFS